jgi:hypothetical protein
MSKAAELANLIGNINAGGGGTDRNIIINGAMNVAQRGTSSTGISSGGYYTVDRFKVSTNSAGRSTMTQEAITDLPGFANAIKLDCTTTDTSLDTGEYLQLSQYIEGQNLQTFAKGTSDAKPMTVSFYVKGNGNATYMCELYDGDNGRRSGIQFSVTSSWNRVSLTFDGDTTGAFDDDNALSLYLNLWLAAGSGYSGGSYTANTWASNVNANRAVGADNFYSSTDNEFFITGFQMEVGQNATTFEHEPFDRTLTKCERYFQRSFHTASNSGNSQTYPGTITALATANNSLDFQVQFRTQLRTAPTFTFYRAGASGDMYNVDNAGTLSSVSLSQNWFDANGMGGLITSGTPFSTNTRYGFDYDMDAEL